MKLKILCVNPTAVHGGAEEALLRVMLTSQKLDYEPILVVPEAGWLTKQAQEHSIDYALISSLPSPFVADRWQIQMRPLLPNAITMANLVRKHKASLVLSNTPRVSYHAGLGARLAGAKSLTYCHDIRGNPFESKRKARFLGWVADRILAPSQAVKQAITETAEFLQPRLQVLYYGWDRTLYDGVQRADIRAMFNLPSNTVLIGNASAMTPWKGQDVLIDAFRQLYPNNPKLRLIIVGGVQGGSIQKVHEKQLHDQVAQYGLQEVVIFTGWREDVWSFIKGFDVFVHVPIQPDPLPTVLLHACALGQACIASNTGGIPEIVLDQQTGLLVPPQNVDALCSALQTLLADSEAKKLYGERSILHFEQRFSSKQLKEGLKIAYDSVLK